MSAFLTKLTATKIGNGESHDWELHEPLGYYSDVLQEEIWVPTGFRTDFASVPRLPVTWFVAGSIGDRSAVVHDYLCRTEYKNRSITDRVFLEALKSEEVTWWRRYIMYAGVRLGAVYAKFKRL